MMIASEGELAPSVFNFFTLYDSNWTVIEVLSTDRKLLSTGLCECNL